MSKRLNLEKRMLLEKHLSAGWSCRRIAAALCVAPSTIGREVARNGGRCGYQAGRAQRRAADMRAGIGPSRVSTAAWKAAKGQLRQRWSPEAIAASAPSGLAISAATIRRRIAEDRRNHGALFRHLRRRGKPRLSRAERQAQQCNNIPGRVHFSQRPQAAHRRQQGGHWEMDTFMDPGQNRRAGALILADRATRVVLLFPLPHFNARACADAAIALLRRRPARSITADNGGEFAQHRRITQTLGVPVFFTDPGSPQQRGTCENAIALVRDLAGGRPLAQWSPRRLRDLAERINRRPMKTHGWLSRNQAALLL